MSWNGDMEERERELKHAAKEGRKTILPAYKTSAGEEDGTQYHQNGIVLFFFYINKQNDVVSHKTCHFI
jgi:hypothetical protein